MGAGAGELGDAGGGRGEPHRERKQSGIVQLDLPFRLPSMAGALYERRGAS